jgi:hypothetical protein
MANAGHAVLRELELKGSKFILDVDIRYLEPRWETKLTNIKMCLRLTSDTRRDDIKTFIVGFRISKCTDS